jgi:branched-chain amino acid transport system substrate-binding protein
MSLGWRRALSLAVLGVLAVALSVALAACGSDDNDKGSTSSASSTPASTTETATTAAKCGLGNGQKATGEPIRIGAIVTKQPGTDFTDIPNMTQAYFDCVNDNGGINGRPVKLFIEEEQTDPGQIASLAKKLVETDKVVAIVGNISLIECAVNHKYWEAKGYYVLTAGIAPECYGTSNYAAVNMGPRYSSDGAVQAAIRAGAKKIAFDQSNVPGTVYIAAGPSAIAKAHNVEIKQFKDTTPIKDANSVALKLVQAAGKDGSVVLNFTPPEALKILQAAQKLGLQDRVVSWGCSTPCNTDFVAKALGPKWDDKLLVNAELNVTDFDGPDSTLYRDVLSKYGKKVVGGAGSFSQMGFLLGDIATDAMMDIKGDINAKSVNAAIKAVKDYKTDILCKPWYFLDAPAHIPNNTDWTTTTKEGKMVIKEDCFEIDAADPDIAKIRAIEKKDGINQ